MLTQVLETQKASIMVATKAEGLGAVRRSLIDEVKRLAEEDGAAALLWSAIKAGLAATKSEREGLCGEWQYVSVPDHGTRLLAARLGADVLGLTPKSGVNVTMQDNRIQISVADQVAEFVSVGGDAGELLAEMQAVVAGAEAAGIKPKGADAQLVEAAPTQAQPAGAKPRAKGEAPRIGGGMARAGKAE
jgi:hypothetical protein